MIINYLLGYSPVLNLVSVAKVFRLATNLIMMSLFNYSAIYYHALSQSVVIGVLKHEEEGRKVH